MRAALAFVCLFGSWPFQAGAQQIYDIWQTTWDRQPEFGYTNLGSSPINFGSPGPIGAADIVVNDAQVYQSVVGFGGSLTDSAALVLSQLKSKNSGNYWALLESLFDPTDGANSGGLTFLRVPLGASDFSANTYSYDDHNGDTSLSQFSINAAPSYLFSTIKDIQSINNILKVYILPWSPPGWMKSGTMDGGSLQQQYVQNYANYLLKCVQGFASKGITPYALSIQNEPQNSDPTYPSTSMSYQQMGQIGTALRTLLNKNGYTNVRIIGYEHNWDSAATYPVPLMQSYGSAFDGVAFHCYAGDYTMQQAFTNAYPSKELYFTECAGTLGTDWWSDIKWYFDNLWIGAISYNAMSGMMWNIAVHGDGSPVLPGADSCGGPGCRGIATVNTDGTYSLNQEFTSMAHASKAILPKDSGGPWGKRMGVSVNGNIGYELRVGAYVTGRVSSSDWQRYALVVLNWNDADSNGNWDPQPVQTTIEFRGQQASYTFPVGVTTLWWYAPATSFNGTSNAKMGGKQVVFSQDK